MLTSCLRRYSLQHHIMVLIVFSVLIINLVYLFLYWQNISFLTTLYVMLGSSLAVILITYRITQKLMNPLGLLSQSMKRLSDHDITLKPALQKDSFISQDVETLFSYLVKIIEKIDYFKHQFIYHKDIQNQESFSHSKPVLDTNFPIDHTAFNKLREILGSSLESVIEAFLEDTPIYLKNLDSAIQEKNYEAISKNAHAIKGSSSNLAATGLTLIAKEIEELAKLECLDDISSRMDHIQQTFEDVRRTLSNEKFINDRLIIGDNKNDIIQALVVEDDRSTRTTLRYTLERDGFRVEEAENGEQALSRLTRFEPDIILMDAMMPVMDGFIACKKIQELPRNHTIPVLMITALEDHLSVEQAFAAGARDYISKPIHFATLTQRVRRIIEATQAEKYIYHLAHHDALTGLPNRVAFLEQLKRYTIKSDTDPKLGLLYLNLDRFKNINDSLGHSIGDRVLVAVSQRISNTTRSTDYVARIGGDEFAILLHNLANTDAAATAAQHICNSLDRPFRIDEHDIFVSVRIGISLFPDDTNDPAALLKYADTAMHETRKENTKFHFFKKEMETAISERMLLEHDLRLALSEETLQVFYQPQADLSTGAIVGMEALVRWNHPTRGFIPPMEFIPLAEETGLILPLGEWVMQTACLQLKRWSEAGLPPIRMAVNVSVHQLLKKEFVGCVDRILKQTQLNPKLLELEITESTLMENAETTLEILHELRKLGVRMSIDDFGTGYSSLAYLRRFPVDIIKIDRSFVKDVPENPDANAIATGIIVLAHSLRLEVVAEGVETESQLRLLQSQHCDMMQGYYLGKPVPAEEFNHEFLTKAHFQ
ncbi:MAG: EAL domain-containing protein [Pseudomonadota bacterium]